MAGLFQDNTKFSQLFEFMNEPVQEEYKNIVRTIHKGAEKALRDRSKSVMDWWNGIFNQNKGYSYLRKGLVQEEIMIKRSTWNQSERWKNL